jgi:tetratricopeptide (TPR) repeat protein
MKFPLFFTGIALTLLLGACGNKEAEQAADAERHLRSATAYTQQGQLRAAMIEAKNAIQLQPQNAAGYIALATIYNRMGAYSATQSLLENILATHPQTSTALAEAYLGSQKYRSAVQVLTDHPAQSADEKLKQLILLAKARIPLGDKSGFENALAQLAQHENHQLESELLKARWSLANGDSKEAADSLTRLLANNPDHFEALVLQGEIALYQNNLPVAEKHFTRALTTLGTTDIMTAQRIMVLNQLTDVLIREGRTSEAYAYQKLLSEANPESHSAQQRFNEALELYQAGNFTEAEAMLTALHEEFPQNSTTGTLLGLVQHQLGRDESAAELFDQHIDPETASTSLIQTAVLTKLRADQDDEALALLKMATENQPQNPALLASYGLALLDKDQTSNEGALALEKSIALDASQQRLRIALAKRYLAMENQEQALAQLQKAYSEAPLDIIIQQSYFQALISNGEQAEVKTLIDQFKQQFPNNPRGDFLAGWLGFEEKDYDTAKRAFEKAIAHPDNTEKQFAYAGLAQVYTLQQQPQKAAETWQAALQADPAMIPAYAHWLRLMQELNRSEDAIAFLTNLEQSSQQWQPSVMLARIRVSQNNTQQAITHIDTALARSNNSLPVKQLAANLYHQQGATLLGQQKLADAKPYLLRALKFFPDNTKFVASMVQAELAGKNVAEAQKLLDQLAPKESHQATRFNLQAMIRIAEGKPEEALQLYRQSWQTQPNDTAAEAIFNHLQKNQAEQLNAFVDEWMQKLPESPKPTLVKAMNAQKDANAEEAIKWYEKTLELAPHIPAALNNLAWIYYEQKDPRALELAKRAYELAPTNAAILDTYGWILVETGDVKQGHRILEQAAQAAPENREIQQHLSAAKERL